MPGRAGSPTSAISGKRARRPFTRVPVGLPAPGWTTSPGGLSTTTTSASSYTTCTTTVGSGSTPATSARGSAIRTREPSDTRSLTETSTFPSTSTDPPFTSDAATARLTPVTIATTRSSRSPSSAAGTSISVMFTAGWSRRIGERLRRRASDTDHNEEDATDDHCRIGDVPHRVPLRIDEVDDVTAEETVAVAEEPVEQVADCTAEDQASGDGRELRRRARCPGAAQSRGRYRRRR